MILGKIVQKFALNKTKLIQKKAAKVSSETLSECKPVTYGKHKIKRYLYHLTSEENYKKMLETGMMKTHKCGSFDVLAGIFMTDLQNLTKRWRCSKDWDKHGNLGYALLGHIYKGGKNIVCLRIPTKNLNHEILRVRSQNTLFKTRGMGKDKSELACDAHELIGSHAKNRNLFARRKEAVEYIYLDNIPVNNVQLVGKADLSEIVPLVSKTKHSDKKTMQGNIFLTTLKTLFKGQPEMKGLDVIR